MVLERTGEHMASGLVRCEERVESVCSRPFHGTSGTSRQTPANDVGSIRKPMCKCERIWRGELAMGGMNQGVASVGLDETCDMLIHMTLPSHWCGWAQAAISAPTPIILRRRDGRP